MKNILFFIAIISIVVSCTSSKSNSNTEEKKTDKNVLFIIVDDLNTTLGCYGHPLVKTPNVDKLANMGVRFKHAYSNYAVCGPSRGSFLTGLKPETIGILDNRTPLQSVLGDKITLPNLFRQNGFYTMSLGKIFHGSKDHNDPEAWDEIYGYSATELGKKGETRNITDGVLKWCHWKAAEGDDEDQADGQIAKKAVEFIKTKKEKPFFLAVGFHKPHDPFIAPKKYFDMYPLEDCDPPELPEGWTPPYKHTLPGATTVFNKFTDQDKREFLRSYYACTSFMDAQVGKLLDALKESGQMENTLIVFFGDHGYHLGEHNWWNKVTIFEKGTNPPFIMAGQSVGKKGVDADAMFEYIDIYPTMADLFQLKNTPDYLEGKSFVEVIKDPALPFRDEVRAIISRGEMLGRMVKNENYRYVEWDNGKKGRELYDQKNDPIEYNNLAENPDYLSVVSEMRTLLYMDY
ncbi:MAG: sulfatase-like hydrolase/transferase [Draconibacterium sp.]|nr:sulfatase-like hydrolase/transferase [Draconibacterium sp.]